MRKIVVAIKQTKQSTKEKQKQKRISSEKEKQLLEKARNVGLLRVIYKKPNQEPEVKIIDNLFRLKKAIVEYDLEIIPLQNVYIICHNKEQRKGMKQNILLDFCSIAGDIILVQIDKRTREFKSLTQENILWFTEVLNRRSSNNLDANIPYTTQITQSFLKTYNHNIASTNLKIQSNINFEEKLLDAINNINLTLSYLVANKKKWGGLKGIKIRYPEYTREIKDTKTNHLENERNDKRWIIKI